MDYTAIINELNKSTSFDLYRLSIAIRNELENPRRLSVIKHGELPIVFYFVLRMVKQVSTIY